MSDRVPERGGATRRANGRLTTLAAALVGLVLVAGTARDARAEVTVDCEFLEISAKTGDKPSIDPALKPVEKKLKKQPFLSWNQFNLLSHSKKALAKKKAEPIPLKVGAATATLVEIVDKSKVRLTLAMENEKGKQVASNTTTVEAGDYIIFVHPLANNDGHLLSLTCK